MRDVPLEDLHFDGCVSTQQHPDGVQPWRLPVKDVELFHPDLVRSAGGASGVRIRFRSDTGSLRLRVRRLRTYCRYDYDLFVDGAFVASHVEDPEHPIALAGLSEVPLRFPEAMARAGDEGSELMITFGDAAPAASREERVFELWLSTAGPQVVNGFWLDEGASLAPAPDPRPLWVTHGSSISHGTGFDAIFSGPGCPAGSARSPSRSWPAVAAREAGLNLLNLGYSGHFAQAALGFLATVRDGHPTVPLLVLSPVHGSGWREDGSCSALIVAPDREAVDPRYPTLSQMRAELERVVGLLQRRGDDRIAYASGLDLFGPDDFAAGLAPDQLHPSPDGYELMGQRFAQLAFGPRGRLLPGRLPPAPTAVPAKAAAGAWRTSSSGAAVATAALGRRGFRCLAEALSLASRRSRVHRAGGGPRA
ncbi:hypothetical protein EMIHUDRAFT_96932 [Emiliania huxleyi CCMP1516]|uniref:SsfX3-like N-terminal domain-containing protein n=2 Tax=Emiliania huxleyi TaxID=2903 RepID=A0A0D3I735_EMIH1|nr:hypothetical protein EMIHUDRAFT_96932 [Emiliania huxleyi CCMP1516]EOD07070.1 hypothetical protein EMIHUDRAFT_96932 [Emiliania huxleyi CCMP1516]|eukprot:XP_005759499.1 hypothetical protein EMIHUDRAFT_96932 [Emiliania huxleyi CCMP1516]